MSSRNYTGSCPTALSIDLRVQYSHIDDSETKEQNARLERIRDIIDLAAHGALKGLTTAAFTLMTLNSWLMDRQTNLFRWNVEKHSSGEQALLPVGDRLSGCDYARRITCYPERQSRHTNTLSGLGILTFYPINVLFCNI